MWPPASISLHPDKSCIVNISPTSGDESTWWTMHSALVPKENTIPTGIPGHYFTLNAKATFQRTPFVATFEGTNDEVILAYKVEVSNRVYAIGVPVDKLIAFKPPQGRGNEVDEAALLSMRKLPCEGMKEVTTLVNTSTHKLADCTDILIGHLPLFKRANIKCLKDLAAIEAAATAKNVARAFDGATLGMRKQAAQKGALSKDANDANGAAKEAADMYKTG